MGLFPQREVEIYNFNFPFNERQVEHIYTHGEVKNGIFYGKKTAIFLNGDHFQADYTGDEFLGTGKFYFAKEKMTYEGSFQNDHIWGKGTLTFEKGCFVGDFIRGKADGEGIVIYKNGDFFKGTFYSNLPQKGKIHWKEIGEYEGTWEHGKPDVNCDFSENYKEIASP